MEARADTVFVPEALNCFGRVVPVDATGRFELEELAVGVVVGLCAGGVDAVVGAVAVGAVNIGT